MEEQKPRLQPIQQILCDDVRVEANGKFILIGVYADGLLVPSFPTQLLLSLWMTFRCVGIGKVPVGLQVRGPGQEDKIEMQTETDLRQDGRVNSLVVGGLSFRATEPSEIKVLFRQYQEEWELLSKFTIGKLDVPASAYGESKS
ncbi:MAG: hypothetical protein ABTQ34_03395 [Bdellovibrionales bacterium]